MSAGQLEAHLFGGAVQGPSWSLTTDRYWAAKAPRQSKNRTGTELKHPQTQIFSGLHKG